MRETAHPEVPICLNLVVWKLSQVRVIEGQFGPREPKLVRVIGSFEKSRVREIGGEIVELE